MKRALKLALGAALGLTVVLALVALAIPYLVQVDRYRPLIEERANAKLAPAGAHLTVGKLSLSVWGRIRVGIEGVTLTRASGAVKEELFSLGSAEAILPWSSLWDRAPRLEIRGQGARLRLARASAGASWNWLEVLAAISGPAPGAPSPADAAAPAGGASPPAAGSVAIPALVLQSSVSVFLRQVQLLIQDPASKLDVATEVALTLQDVSLTRPTRLELAGTVRTEAAGARLDGPFVLRGQVAPQLADGGAQFTAELEGELSGLEIRYGELFHKPAGTRLGFAFSGTFDPRSARLASLSVALGKLELKGKGLLSLGSSGGPGGPTGGAPTGGGAEIDLASAPWELAELAEWVPMARAYGLGGKLRLEASLKGPLPLPEPRAKLELLDVRIAKAPGLAVPLTIAGVVDARLGAVSVVDAPALRLQVGEDRVQAALRLEDFAAPRITASIQSASIDLDRWMPPAAAAAPATQSGKTNTKTGWIPAPTGLVPAAWAATAPAAAADYDALVAPLRAIPMLARSRATLAFDLARVRARGYAMTGLLGTLSTQGLAGDLELKRGSVFGGALEAKARLDLAASPPRYTFKGKVKGLDLQAAVAAEVALFKDTLIAKLDAQAEGAGMSLVTERALAKLVLKGSFEARDAVFATVDVGRMARDAVQRSLAPVAEKLPPLKGKQLPEPPAQKMRYARVTGSFAAADGRFAIPDFTAVSAPGAGIDLKGTLKLGLVDRRIDGRLEVTDTHNLTKARDLSLEQGGVRVDNILAERGQPVRFPVTVSGTMAKPEYSYTEAPIHLARIAADNAGRALKGVAESRLKQEAQKRAQELLEKSKAGGAPAVRDALKKLFQ